MPTTIFWKPIVIWKKPARSKIQISRKGDLDFDGAGYENRTRASCLASTCTTTVRTPPSLAIASFGGQARRSSRRQFGLVRSLFRTANCRALSGAARRWSARTPGSRENMPPRLTRDHLIFIPIKLRCQNENLGRLGRFHQPIFKFFLFQSQAPLQNFPLRLRDQYHLFEIG